MRRKLFGEIVSEDGQKTRRSLFSNNNSSSRRKLFCGCDNEFVCQDCGEEFTDKSNSPAGLRCPNCGGNRVVKKGSLNNISDTCDATDETLKEFSGTTQDYGVVEKTFTEKGIDLGEIIESGYANYDEASDTVSFSENCDELRKLFSCLVISVTKELELDPVDSKEALIQKLSESVSPKSIVMIKKAHGIDPVIHNDSESEDYIKDSGLENDLKLEY